MLALVVLSFRIAVPLMLRKRFLAVVNDLTSLVVGDLLKVLIVVPVDDSLLVDMLSTAVGVVWHRHILDVRLLLTRTLRLETVTVPNYKRFNN